MIGHRTYNGEWLVMDGKAFDRVTFRDCILVYHGGDLRITNATLENCDLVGPWPLPHGAKRPARYVGDVVAEPEVVLKMQRPAPRPKPTPWLCFYWGCWIFLGALVVRSLTL